MAAISSTTPATTYASPTPSRRMTLGFARARRQWRGLSQNTRATLWMLLSFCFFTFEMIATRMLGDSVPTAQLVLVRSAAQLIVLTPFLIQAGPAAFRTQHMRLHATRGLLSVLGFFAFFYSYSQLPLASAVSISFARNLFIVAFAALVLGEIVRWRRWTATVIGLVGVLVIMRPGVQDLSPAYVVAVGGAAMGAAITLATRALATREAPVQIMAYIAVFTTLGSLVPGLIAWKAPDAWQAFWLCVIGFFGPIGQYIAIRAFRLGEASALAPVDYARLLFAVGAGLIVFGEVPDRYTLAGAGIIIASTLYITYREAVLARQARAAS
ncbi:MAG: DMT family transporter [Alphaproteobacteria bacterium]|nr:DMT family transporter [Alphaproteobacteria bacterium]